MANKRLILTDSQLAFLKLLEKHDCVVALTESNFYWPGKDATRLGKRVDGRTVWAAIRRRWVNHPEMSRMFKQGRDFRLTKTAKAGEVLQRVKSRQNVEVQKKRVAA